MSPSESVDERVRQIDVRVREIMAVVLRRPVGPTETVSQANEAGWDSLHHVELIFSIEDEFDVRFEEAELPQLTSLDAVVDAVARLTRP